jgi:hypothetical protein
MAQPRSEDLTVVTFANHAVFNEGKSIVANRPIFDDVEICHIAFAGDTKRVCVFPATEAEPNATREKGFPVSYAEVYSEQYRRFKLSEQQAVAGTPLAEAPFLTEGKRRELRALNVHSIEALAALDGPNLKMLGMGGRELKNQAIAYLENAAGSADVVSMAAQMDKMRETIDALKADLALAAASRTAPTADASDGADKSIEDCTDAELHAYIKEASGSAMPPNTGRKRLLERATELATAGEQAA